MGSPSADNRKRRVPEGPVQYAPHTLTSPKRQHQPDRHGVPETLAKPKISTRELKRSLVPYKVETDATYWSVGKWGFPGEVAKTKSRSRSRYYQRNTVPFAVPNPSVFESLNEVEALMRATLAAMASMNEDEKMILLRQFKWQERQAQAAGEYSPAGLLTVHQFMAAWQNLGVGVSQQQATALFIKYNCDTEGLLPYTVFAMRLLSDPARILALEPEQKGAYRPNGNLLFNGKIRYRYCKKPVFPPSYWDGSLAARSCHSPKAGLHIEFVYGYAGKMNTAPNLYFNDTGKIVYYTAALGIVYDPVTHTQRFFKGHNDDIRCLAIHPDRHLAATGQVAPSGGAAAQHRVAFGSSQMPGGGLPSRAGGGGGSLAADARATAGQAAGEEPPEEQDDCPYICVWNTNPEGSATGALPMAKRIEFPPEGNPPASSRCILALGFSPDGQRLAAVTGDNRHTVYVIDWRTERRVFQGVGHNGEPPQVFGAVWNPFCRGVDRATNQTVPAPFMFVTYGCQHLKFWRHSVENGAERYSSSLGVFGKGGPKDVMSACFLPKKALATGCRSGEVLVWNVGTSGPFGRVLQVLKGHDPGVPMPSPHNGSMQLKGVRAMALRQSDTELLTGGADGRVLVWDVSGSGTKPVSSAPVSVLEIKEPLEPKPAAVVGLDALPGRLDIIAGTHRCDIWSINGRSEAEPLIYGHMADLYGIAFHPKKPHKFATACESSRVFLWNCRRRALIAKCTVGVKARSVAFSPDGAHLAVGTVPGIVKVLSVENLTQTIAQHHHMTEAIDELKYSPNGTKLAVGSHDNHIDVHDVTKGYRRLFRCYGHSSYITHIDWAADSRLFQSTCGAYELLYFDAFNGKQVKMNQRDTSWHTWTSTLGFPVMGIWPDCSDGTDINAVCRSYQCKQFADQDPLSGEGEYCVSAGDDGRVRMFNYPAVIEDAPSREYVGHSSHVMCARFAPSNRWVVSVGGKDRAVIQWKVDRQGRDQQGIPGKSMPLEIYVAPKRRLIDPTDLERLDDEAARRKAAEELRRQKEKEEAERMASARHTMKPDEVEFEIVVHTSDVRGAGTSADVFAVLYGEKGNSGELRLDNDPANFERGRTDTFLVKGKATGRLEKLRIGHDNAGTCPGWHLDRVEVVNKTNPALGDRCVFQAARWLEGTDNTAMLEVGKVVPRPRKYTVTIRTSNVKGAGTDAQVYITLFGEHNKAGPLLLEATKSDFERGAVDSFTIEAEVTAVTKIEIGHDNSGPGPSWHLRDVRLSSVGRPDLLFIANRWLATDEGDGYTSVILTPASEGEIGREEREYRVTVYTSDIKGAGTDADVFIVLSGKRGDSGRRQLDASKNSFERTSVDDFHLKVPDLGELTELEIGHNNRGEQPGWHCEQVVVQTMDAPSRWTFPCEMWFDQNEGDRLIRRKLKPMNRSADIVRYDVIVQTSDIKGAGTDANVHLIYKGKRGGKEYVSERFTLDNSRNNFERNMKDTFILKKQPRLDSLDLVIIGHDNTGPAPGWHLDSVEFLDSNGQQVYFPCQKWLDKQLDGGMLERELTPAPKDDDATRRCGYKVTVVTSDIKFAGTDANVFLELYGDRNGTKTASGRTKLVSSQEDFERGRTDVFNLEFPNLGTIERITIGHDESVQGSKWHLDRLEVLSIQTGQLEVFKHNNWIPTEDQPPKNPVVLFPKGVDVEEMMTKYTFVVYTSDVKGAGTDANVAATLFGEGGKQTREMRLASSENDFERGCRNSFVVEALEVGTMSKLRIGHDSHGENAAWHLQHVEVANQETGDRAMFVADQWMDKDKGTAFLELERVDARSPHQLYRVTVQTSDVRGAGTDGDITIKLHGDQGDSDELPLESSADNFERNQRDEFLLNLRSQVLGKLQKINIGFAAKQSGRDGAGKPKSAAQMEWGLQHVEVVDLNSGETYLFPYQGWLKLASEPRIDLTTGQESGKNYYEVIVRTSDIKGAGTDAAVCIVLFGKGEDGTSLRFPADGRGFVLDNSADNFERNKVDRFLVSAPDLGALSRVQIDSDGSGGQGAAWHLQQVEVLDSKRGQTAVFPCNRWLDPAEPATLQQVLQPGDQGSEGLATYVIRVETSDLKGAGTDARVFIEMHGDKDATARRRLESTENAFERGKTDEFRLRAINVGELQHVLVGHDGSGPAADWHLQAVEIENADNGKRWSFLCDAWLKKEKGQKEVVQKLLCGQGAGSGSAKLRVSTFTSDLRGAGTDADVACVVYGTLGDSGERKLDNSANNFERNREDTFEFVCSNIGEIQALKIWHNNRGLAAGWHLDRVEVTNTNTGELKVFPFKGWLDKKNGLEQLLHPDIDGDGIGDRQAGLDLVDYTVKVFTSDVRGAGTDANVTIELYGTRGTVGATTLDNDKNNFERGREDVFKINATDVGDVERIVIQHDNSRPLAGWHLKQVEVYNPDTRKTYFFPCNAWLEKTRDNPNGCRKELLAGVTGAGGMASYKVVVHTSNMRGAGTDANVFCNIFGEQGNIGERVLDNSSNNFERNRVDTFFLEAPNIGAMQQLKLRCDARGLFAAWHLAKVDVTNSATGETLVFPFNNWVNKENGWEHLLDPDIDGDGVGDRIIGKQLLNYKVTVYTSDLRGAGTDANVTLSLVGEDGFVGETRLENSANNFERNQKDTFVITGSDVGEIKDITIGHDNSGLLQGAAWHLQQVEVYHPGLDKTYHFTCNDWLQKTKEHGLETCKRTLQPGQAGQSGPSGYRVEVVTSDLRGAGTDADVFLTVYGEEGDTGERVLDNSANNFERGRTDTFFFQCADVGRMLRARVRSTGRGLLGAAWHLASITVTNTSTGERAVFPFNGWLDKKHGLAHDLHPDIDGDGTGDVQSGLELVDYDVTTFTSDERGAGTDARVYIELHGTDGFIGETQLENDANNFERNRRDDFVVRGRDIGEVEKVVVWHDNSGMLQGAAWHLAQVEVSNPAMGKSWLFPCHQWLQKTKEEGLDGCRKELFAGKTPDGVPHVYKVVVHTSDTRGAGTDAGIEIEVHGEHGDSGRQRLETSDNNFERGKEDTFFIKCRDLGKMVSLKVVGDGKGFFASWHLAKITVTNTITSKHAVFPYHNWIDNKRGWTQLLYPDVDGDGIGDKIGAELQQYEIRIVTSDVRGAGTDASVWMEITGDKGFVGERLLENAEDNFQRGREDVFVIEGPEVGAIQSVKVRTDGKGWGSAWHFQTVEITNRSTQDRTCFVYDDWLDKGSSNPEGEVVLTADSGKAGSPMQFKVQTFTSGRRGAGTDAPVFLELHGTQGMLGGRPLELANSRNNFEAGREDVFLLNGKQGEDIGEELIKVVVERGNTCLPFPDWHLDHLVITNMQTGRLWKLCCRDWLSKRDGLRKVWTLEDHVAKRPQDLQLVEGDLDQDGDGQPDGEPFLLVVETSGRLGAGTDALVGFEFEDVEGRRWEPVLSQTKRHFERGCRDEFTLRSMEPLEEIRSAAVWQDGRGCFAGWHLSSFRLTHLRSGRAWKFTVQDWVAKATSAANATHVAAVVDNDVPLRLPEDAAPPLEMSPEPELAAGRREQSGGPQEYECAVTTGSKFGAGIDAEVHIVLQGTQAVLTQVLPGGQALYNKGAVDSFRLTASSPLGELLTLTVWHASSGLGAEWYLERISVQDLITQAKWIFVHKGWIRGGEDNRVTLKAKAERQASTTQRLDLVGMGHVDPPGQMLSKAEFWKLPGLQPRLEDSKALGVTGEESEPTCDWQKHTVPYPSRPQLEVTFYHNPSTGESVYEQPPEHAAWEQQQRLWAERQLTRTEELIAAAP